eukprot:3648241-Rhodomonas_salina.1
MPDEITRGVIKWIDFDFEVGINEEQESRLLSSGEYGAWCCGTLIGRVVQAEAAATDWNPQTHDGKQLPLCQCPVCLDLYYPTGVRYVLICTVLPLSGMACLYRYAQSAVLSYTDIGNFIEDLDHPLAQTLQAELWSQMTQVLFEKGEEVPSTRLLVLLSYAPAMRCPYYDPTRCPVRCYALAGTEEGMLLPGCAGGSPSVWCCATPGTDLAYGATSYLHADRTKGRNPCRRRGRDHMRYGMLLVVEYSAVVVVYGMLLTVMYYAICFTVLRVRAGLAYVPTRLLRAGRAVCAYARVQHRKGECVGEWALLGETVAPRYLPTHTHPICLHLPSYRFAAISLQTRCYLPTHPPLSAYTHPAISLHLSAYTPPPLSAYRPAAIFLQTRCYLPTHTPPSPYSYLPTDPPLSAYTHPAICLHTLRYLPTLRIQMQGRDSVSA